MGGWRWAPTHPQLSAVKGTMGLIGGAGLLLALGP